MDIDRSSDRIEDLTYSSLPEFKEETIFLKVLTEGQATLYSFTDTKLNKFFFKNKENKIEQLVYKRYLSESDYYAYNNSFRSQINQNYKCESIDQNQLRKVDYKEVDLLKIFRKYNECNNSFVEFDSSKKSNKMKFHLSVRPRLTNSKLTYKYYTESIKFGNETAIGVGLEGEFVLPFNKNKWAVIIEPTFQSYKANKKDYTNVYDVKVDLKTIEVPFGGRYYMFLNQNSKLFVNALYMYNIDLSSSFDYTYKGKTYSKLDINSSGNFAFGFGYKFKDRFNLEVRYSANRKVMDYISTETDYSTLSFILGYTIF